MRNRQAVALLFCVGVLAGCSSPGAPAGQATRAPEQERTLPSATSGLPVSSKSGLSNVVSALVSGDTITGRYTYRVSAMHQDRTRTWMIAVRENRAPEFGTRALLIALHGAGSNGTEMRMLGLEDAAESYVVAYPDAIEGTWDDGRQGVDSRAHREQIDDVDFLRQLVTDAQTAFGIDPTKVFVVGLSNGGIMAARLSCAPEFPLRAVALVSALPAEGLVSRCTRQESVPTLVIHGSADRVIPEPGGNVARIGAAERGSVMGLAAYYEMLFTRAGCTERVVRGDQSIERWEGKACTTQPGPIVYRIRNGGHEWFREPQFSTTQVVSKYFQSS